MRSFFIARDDSTNSAEGRADHEITLWAAIIW